MRSRWVIVMGITLLTCVTAMTLEQTAAAQKKADSYVKVEVKGKLQTGIAAIGGETTGILIRTGVGVTWELDLGKDKELRAKADKLSGKTVVVKGELTIRRGVEVRQRAIVKVSSLEAAK